MCPDCVKRVEEEERYIDTIRSAAERIESETLMGGSPTEPGSGQARPGFALRRYALAAGLAVVLIGGSVALRFSGSRAVAEVDLRWSAAG